MTAPSSTRPTHFRKLLLLLALLSLTAALTADVFLPQFYLKGYHPVVENEVDYYKYHRGLRFTSLRSYFIDDFSVTTRITPQREQQRVLLTPMIGRRELGRPAVMSFTAYLEASTRARFHQLLRKNVYEVLQDDDRDSGQGIFNEFQIELPRQAIPKPFRRVLGTTARLSIDGSQKLTFAGESTVRENAGLTESGSQQDFDLKMKQDLRLRLRGTIGDKIHVNVNHTSSSEESLSNPNEIEIKYVGVEDEIVQEIEAGNISLSLPSTTYVGYSASSESLFGVKSRLKIGYLELTTIVGKEEGQKTSKQFTGSSEADSIRFRSVEYARRTHYFLADPSELYVINSGDIPNQPPLWMGNAIDTENGKWLLRASAPLPADGSVKLYLDDNDASNDEIFTIEGHSIDDPLTTYHFEELIEDIDYVVNYDVGFVAMNRDIDQQYTIGLVYTPIVGDPVGNADENNLTVRLLRKGNQVVTDPTWKLQMRNVYKLPMQNIKNDGFSFNIFTYNANETHNYNVPDSVDTGGVGDTYIDYLKMDTNNDGLINGDDETVDLTGGYILFPFIEPFKSIGDYEIYEDERERVDYNDVDIYMYAKGDIGRDIINLNQINVLKGSVRVKVDGRTLTENVDYIVDYDFGSITFLTSEGKNPDAEIVIDFEYKPMFAVESKTMAGFRAEMKFSENTRMGATFVYHSEKVADKRPKIGNENRTQILADIDGEVKFDPPFMTRLVDMLPLVRTDEESELSLAGELALNLPTIYGNPDKKDDPEAYLEDMESVLSIFPLGVTRSGWSVGSQPYDSSLPRARVNWWNPPDVYASEVYEDSLLTEDDQDEKVSMLRFKVMPTRLQMPGTENRSWGGVMKYVGNRLDFSDKKYIEVMVRIDTTQAYSDDVLMHIDLGDVSEDFYTEFGGLGVLNSEDGKNGGDKDGLYDYLEDIGLDGVKNGDPGDDPEDDFDADKVAGEFPNINGTEGNKQLDTEDLDGNGSLNTNSRYFNYTLSLASDDYLESANSKGFRIYRIPFLDDEAYREVTNTGVYPSHEEISYVRMWFEVSDTTYIDIVNVDVVGNKWESQPIREVGGFLADPFVTKAVLDGNGESMAVGVTDNIDNTHYTAPPETTEKKDGVETLEQSLVIDYTNLDSDHYGFVRQRFIQSNAYNLLTYNKIRFFAYPELVEGETYADPIELFLRLGADSLNYYEISVLKQPYPYDMNPSGSSAKMQRDLWYDIEVDFSKLTQLKIIDTNEQGVVSVTEGDFTYRRVRAPTLSSIREMQLGVRMPGSSAPFTGRVYYNDIRVADPYDDAGYAARTTLNAKFADFMTFDATLSWQTPNFYTISSRSSNTAQEERVELSLNNRYNLQKFFPAEWGLSLPLTLSWRKTEKTPRFKANSDILVEDLDTEERERQTTTTTVRSAGLTFSQSRTPTNWLLAFTVKNTSLGGDIRETVSTGPTTADTTLTYSERLTYNLDIPKEKLDLTLWKDYKLFFAPNSFRNTYTFKATYPKRWRWEEEDDEYKWVPVSQTVDERTVDTSNEITYDLLSDTRLKYTLTTNRNLRWRNYWNNLNIGREKSRRQDWDLRYDPTWSEEYVGWNANLDIKYKETQKEDIVTDPETGGKISEFTITGNVTRTFDVDVTLKNRDMLNGLIARLGGETQNMRGETPRNAPKQDFPEEPDKPEDEDMMGEKGDPTVIRPDEPLPQDDPPAPSPFVPEDRGDGEGDKPEEPRDKIPEDEKPEGEKPEDPEKVEDEKQEDEGKRSSTNPLVFLLQYLARLENIQMNYTNSYGTSFDEREDSPDFLYQLSIPHILVGEDILQKNDDDSFSANTALPILDNLTTQWRYSYSISRSYTNSTNQVITQVFPSVTASLSRFETLVGLEDHLSQSSVNTSWTLTRKESGNVDWESPETTVITNAFQPLLGWTGKWSFDLDTSVSYNLSSTENINHNETNDIVRLTNEQRVNANFTHRLNAAQGIKLPFLKRWMLKNEFTTTFDITYERKQTTSDNGSIKQTELDTASYKFRLSGTYNFHRNVEGGSQITYDWLHNLKKDEKVKTFGLSVWVQILF